MMSKFLLKRFFFSQKHLLIVAIFLLTLTYTIPFSIIDVDLHHDGLMFYPAQAITQGETPYLDFFSLYSPLTHYLHAFMLIVFGPRLIVIRLLTAFFYAFIAVLLYLIWSRFLPSLLNLAGIILWLSLAPFTVMTFLPWPSVYALAFQLITLLLVLYISASKTKLSQTLFLFSAGLTTSLTFWFRQNVGIFVFLSCLTIIPLIKKPKIKPTTIYIMGFFLGILSGIAWILQKAAIIPWWQQNFQIIPSFIQTLETQPFPGNIIKHLILIDNLVDLFNRPLSFAIWLLMPFSATYLFIHQLSNYLLHKKDFYPGVFIVSAISTSSWMQYYPVSEHRHFFWAVTPMVGCFIFLIYKQFLKISQLFNLKKPKKRQMVLLFKLFTLLISTVFLLYKTHIGLKKISINTHTTKVPILSGLKITPTHQQKIDSFYDQVNQYLEKHPNKQIVNNTFYPLFSSFFPNHTYSPDALYFDWPIFKQEFFPDHDQLVIQETALNPPLLISPTPLSPPSNYSVNPHMFIYQIRLLIPPDEKLEKL